MKIKILFFIVFCCSIYAQNEIDTISIKEVNLLDNRLNTPVSKENRNVLILSQESIDQLPVKSIQELLSYTPGVDLRQRGPFGTQADISLDGGSFEQTLILINGVKIMDHQTAHNAMNLPLPLEAIERVEIVRGPAARVYGNNSLTGIINFITKKTKENTFMANIYTGSNFKKNDEARNKTYNNRGIQIGGSWAKNYHQHQLYLTHEKGNGYRYNTGYENNKLYFQSNYQIDNKHLILTAFGYIKNGFGANGFYASPGDKDSKELVETALATIQTNHQLNSNFKLNSKVNYRYNFDDYRYYKHELNKARTKHYSNAIAAELNANYTLNKGILGLGLEFRNEQINSTSIKQHTRNNLGFYTEYKSDITSNFNINLGTFVNYNSQYGWQIFPGVDVSYQLNDKLKIISNIGTSQRIPSFTDLYLDQRPGNIGNENLKSEKAFQSEFGLKYNYLNWSFDAYYFYRKIDDFIDWIRLEVTNPWEANNFGNLKTNGFNTKVDFKHKTSSNHKYNISLSYSFLEPKFVNTSSEFASKYKIESLKHQLINTINYNNKNTGILIANRFNTRQNYQSYWVTDLRVNYHLFKNLLIYFDVQNVFNTSYNEIGSIPLPNRWMSMGLKFKGI